MESTITLRCRSIQEFSDVRVVSLAAICASDPARVVDLESLIPLANSNICVASSAERKFLISNTLGAIERTVLPVEPEMVAGLVASKRVCEKDQ